MRNGKKRVVIGLDGKKEIGLPRRKSKREYSLSSFPNIKEQLKISPLSEIIAVHKSLLSLSSASSVRIVVLSFNGGFPVENTPKVECKHDGDREAENCTECVCEGEEHF
jgi:hypothetical protein